MPAVTTAERSKVASVVFVQLECIWAEITFLPVFSADPGTSTTTGSATAVAVRRADSAHGVSSSEPSATLERTTSLPLTKTTTPSSARVVRVSLATLEASATSTVLRNWVTIGRVPSATSVVFTEASFQPSTAEPCFQEESS